MYYNRSINKINVEGVDIQYLKKHTPEEYEEALIDERKRQLVAYYGSEEAAEAAMAAAAEDYDRPD